MSREIELTIGGIIHIADVSINGDGTLHFESVCKDNGVDNCDPTPLTPEIIEAVKEYLKDEISEAKADYAFELSTASARGRHYLLNE